MRPEKASRKLRPLLFCSIALCFNSSAFAQYQISSAVTSLPAGSYGASISASASDISPSPDFNICFYTGYGSASPIVPASYASSGTTSQFSVNVPPSTIQDVPPSAFTSGSFTASLYSVPTSATACTGPAQSQQPAASITLAYPTLTSLSLYQLTQQNPNLKTRLPSNLSAIGTNFIGQTGSTGTGTVFNFIAANTVSGSVTVLSPTALITSIPVSLPASSASVTVEVCNSAVYTYCSTPGTLSITLAAQEPLVGTFIASPTTAPPTQLISEVATFGTAAPSASGAPSGLVRFFDGTQGWGSYPLVLDRTASFALQPALPFNVNTAPLPPLIADFNRDGVPDVLFVEPGTATQGGTLHLLVGEGAGPGSFGRNLNVNVQANGSGFQIFSAAVGDFNNDGFPDIVLLAQNTASSSNPIVLYTLLGNGDGTFQNGFQSSPILNGTRIVGGDFNKDGKLDIVVAGSISAGSTVGLFTLLGDGTGNFTAGPATTGLSTSSNPSFGGFKLAAADLNNDGFPDIAVLNGADVSGTLDASVELYQNDGTGAFGKPVQIPTDGTATANFFIASLRGIELPDVIVTSIAASKPGITVSFNQSGDTIAFSGTQFTPIARLKQAVFADFNGDGNIDAAVDNGSTVDVYTGSGSGGFSFHFTKLTFATPAGTTLFAGSDQNGDTYADLLLYTSAVSLTTGLTELNVNDYLVAGTATATAELITFGTGVHTLNATTPGTFYIGPGGVATTKITITAPVPTAVSLTTSPASSANYGAIPIQLIAGIADSTATGSISFYNGSTLLGTAPLVEGTAAASAVLTSATLAAGSYSFTAVYGGDAKHGAGTSSAVPFIVNPVPATLTWRPNPASIVYGTALSSAQLDATATGVTGQKVAGSFSYSSPVGTVLATGMTTVTATFTTADANYTTVSATQKIVVTQATPVVTWVPNPPSIIYGTGLTAAQLDATANTPGTFTYTPALGTVLSAGPQTLSVLFTPTDTVDYTTATASAAIEVSTLVLSSLSQSVALLGDPDTKITLAGSGFVANAAVLINGTVVSTTFVNPSTLTAVIPKSNFLNVQTLQVSVNVASLNESSVSLPLLVVAPIASVTFTGPSSVTPGTQTTLTFGLTNPYPVDLTATLTLGFSPTSGLPVDKSVLFANGTDTFTIVIPANSTATPEVEIQTGTVAGTLTVALGLEAGGANVTPASVQTLNIQAPFAVPGITSAQATADGHTLTVTTRGFSNTREITGAKFHFAPAPGHRLATTDVTLDVGSVFAAWYASPTSQLYGSEFTYTQVFNLNSDASVVGEVTVTLINGQGSSPEANTP